MPHYSGITTDPQSRKAQHKSEHPTLRNWKIANNGNAFPSKAVAQAWEDRSWVSTTRAALQLRALGTGIRSTTVVDLQRER